MDLDGIGVVIPAYNAEKTIGPLVQDIINIGFARSSILIIDDGSTDRTSEAVQHYGVIAAVHEKNKGKGAALKKGFELARIKGLDWVFTIDADGQHRIADIPNFLRYRDQYDIIVGARADLRRMPLLRRWVNRITSLVVSLLVGQKMSDVQCGFRLVDLAVLDKILLRTNHYQTESELIVKAARRVLRIRFQKISTVYENQKSYIKPFVDTLRFVSMAVGFLWR